MTRNLDGNYFRVKRNGEWESICFSDLTFDEMCEVLDDYDRQSLIRMCISLGHAIKDIGDAFDITRED